MCPVQRSVDLGSRMALFTVWRGKNGSRSDLVIKIPYLGLTPRLRDEN